MNRILITGMSGTGKSAVTRELLARGYRAVDLDTPEWSHWVAADPADSLTPAEGKDWVWQAGKVRALLSRPAAAPLFISGCAQNMAEAYPLIDLIILLSAPLAVVMDRLAGRSPSAYGHGEEERRKIADLIDLVEPQLRAAADIEIDTDRAVHATVDEILRIARAPVRTATH